MIKIFQVSSCDWVAAETLEQAMDYYKTCSDLEEDFEPFELGEGYLDTLFFERIDDDTPLDKPISFRNELASRIEKKEKFPQMFAATEY